MSAGHVPIFKDRATAMSSTVAAGTFPKIGYIGSSGHILLFERDAGGTALTTAGGSRWSPSGLVHPDHWADNANPGVTDMATAMQAALTWVAAAGGGVVQLLDGQEYAIAARLTISANTTFDFAGGTIKLLSGADRCFLVNGSNVTIQNGTLNANSVAYLCSASTGKNNLTVRDMKIVDPVQRGIVVTSCSGFTAENVDISWTAAGITAHVALGQSFYGLLQTSATPGVAMVDTTVRNFNVDMSGFTASQMQLLDSGIIIRGDETGSLTQMQGVTVSDCRIDLPIGDLGVTYGTSLPRPTGIEIRTARDVRVENVHTDGGDLTLTFANINNLMIENCTSRNQTNYCMEIASNCVDVLVSTCTLISARSERPISITGGQRVHITSSTLSGGLNSNSAVVIAQNTGTKLTLTGCTIIPLNNAVDGIATVNEPDIVSAVNCTFISVNSGSAGHIHIKTGNAPLVRAIGCTFEGPATRPVKVTSTVTILRVNDCDGIGTPLASLVSSGVTTPLYAGNNNLTNL